jgi:hypothetical protein
MDPNPPPNPTAQAKRAYFWEFSISLVAYVLAIILTRDYLNTHQLDDTWRTLVAVLPILPIIGVFAAIVRLILATDELMRRMIVNSLALAGGVTALLAVTYGLIEGEGFPFISAWWTYVTFMTSWIIAGFFVRRHYR